MKLSFSDKNLKSISDFTPPKLTKIIVDQKSVTSKLFQNIKKNLQKYSIYKNTLIEIVEDYKTILAHYQKKTEYVHEAKDTLLIYPYKGRFLHSCPGSDGMACCHYFVINFGVNCSFDCSYCYLQTYLNIPLLTLFSNVEDLIIQVKEKNREKSKFLLADWNGRIYRFTCLRSPY